MVFLPYTLFMNDIPVLEFISNWAWSVLDST